jgi:hypothetical protein
MKKLEVAEILMKGQNSSFSVNVLRRSAEACQWTG